MTSGGPGLLFFFLHTNFRGADPYSCCMCHDYMTQAGPPWKQTKTDEGTTVNITSLHSGLIFQMSFVVLLCKLCATVIVS